MLSNYVFYTFRIPVLVPDDDNNVILYTPPRRNRRTLHYYYIIITPLQYNNIILRIPTDSYYYIVYRVLELGEKNVDVG